MNEAVFRINNVAIYGFGLLTVFSFLWGSFVFYKKAIESHFESFKLLDSIVMAAFWGFIVGRLGYVILNLSVFWNHFSRIFLISNYPGIDRFGAIIGIVLGIYLAVRRFKSKYMDWLDLVFLGILSGSAVFATGLLFVTYKWQFMVLGLLFLIAFVSFWRIEDKYRTFEWYKGKKTSARSGLITGFSIFLIGAFYILESLLFNEQSLFSLVLGGVIIVGGLSLVYIRSGRTVADDIKFIFKHGKK